MLEQGHVFKNSVLIRVLHVEDDADIRDITQMALSIEGDYDLLQCSSGEDALAKVEHFQPDLLLLDLMMPGMNGPQTLNQMRKIPSLINVPAIFMTARAQNSDIEKLLEQGAAAVICKPFDPISLGSQIKAVLKQTEVIPLCRTASQRF